MFNHNKLLLGLLTSCLCTSAMALPKDAFDELEYHVNTGLEDLLPYGATSLTQDFKDKFSFLKMDDDLSEKWVTFIDTPDRAFGKHNIFIRVREHITKPRKSKLTVKFRAPDPQGFGELDDFSKAEIDFTKQRAAYSVSYDMRYSPSDINVKKVDYQKVFKILKQNSDIWERLGPIYEQAKGRMIQSIVMRTHGWEGKLKNSQHDGIEVDFQIWTPYLRKPRVTFAEFSFKGDASDKADLDKSYQFLSEQVAKTGLADKGHQGSKTNSTFKMTAGFN